MLHGGTKVLTPTGYRKIETLKAGGVFLSRNEDATADRETQYSRVTQLFVRQTDLLFHVTFINSDRWSQRGTTPFG